MNSLVENIMQEAGDMPNPSAHRRYLQSLTEPVLRARLVELKASNARRPVLAISQRHRPQKKAGVC
jgi:hypothetical protein